MADQGSEGLFSPYLRAKRIEIVRPFLKGNVLDVGCGVGCLAKYIPADQYWGMDVDEDSLVTAQQKFPNHFFSSKLPPNDLDFDSVIALAVIEHIHNQLKFLRELKKKLGPEPGNRIILTTPHPKLDFLHEFGASVGLFSRHANEQHEKLLDYSEMASLNAECGLSIEHYSRFLFHANQLFVLKRTEDLT